MSSFLRSLFVTGSVVALLLILVIVEVVVAMFAYMYLALNHVETFGYLVGLSRDVLKLFADQLKQLSPELALRADTTLLGELGPKSILLLLIGLTVSGLGRLAGWIARRWYARASSA
ncbi:MAG: hypothetical protein K8F92_13900 [Hyphomicrobium sp.]|uniref:hypothetical protein n=1 Tax=Hyphomicrobium sp. TaxID=82 RepID=UPI00132432BC|nr:hypothetical protein [Hyphomicrobium sp.]KAB2943488.1 MAG: hypothetical protein F9K20_02020 [Hyphomicrobium sp.]MBZ0210735.1 hypothetical protein [Hyphomicrobium sp.]